MRQISDQQIARRSGKVRELRAAADRLEAALSAIADAVDASRGPLLSVRERRAATAVAEVELRARDTIRRLRNRAAEWEPL